MYQVNVWVALMWSLSLSTVLSTSMFGPEVKVAFLSLWSGAVITTSTDRRWSALKMKECQLWVKYHGSPASPCHSCSGRALWESVSETLEEALQIHAGCRIQIILNYSLQIVFYFTASQPLGRHLRRLGKPQQTTTIPIYYTISV